MIRSPLLFRYLFREVSIATSASFAVVCVILFYGNVVRNDEYFLQALFHSPENFFTLSGLLIPYAAAYALPLGFVVGLLLSLGRMSADKEILAMRTVGLGVGTVLYPVILLALLFSVLSVFLVGEWGPRSRALFDLRKTEIVLNSLDLILKRDGVLTFDIPSVAEEGNAQDPSAALRSLMGSEVRRCGLAAGNVEGDVWRDLRLSFRDGSDRMMGVLSARSATVRRDTVRGVLALHLEGIDLEGRLQLFSFRKRPQPVFRFLRVMERTSRTAPQRRFPPALASKDLAIHSCIKPISTPPTKTNALILPSCSTRTLPWDVLPFVWRLWYCRCPSGSVVEKPCSTPASLFVSQCFISFWLLFCPKRYVISVTFDLLFGHGFQMRFARAGEFGCWRNLIKLQFNENFFNS